MSEPNDLSLLLGRIDGKLDLVLERQSDHDKRLAVLERDRGRLYGALAVIGGLISWLTKDHIAALLSLFRT